MMGFTLRDDRDSGDQKARTRDRGFDCAGSAIGSEIGSDAAFSIPWHATDMPSTDAARNESDRGEGAPILDIVDETFIRARRPDVAMAVRERWATWWPSLTDRKSVV